MPARKADGVVWRGGTGEVVGCREEVRLKREWREKFGGTATSTMFMFI